MQLWNDYEGKTLAGTFPIETLLFTEGRNACFTTRDRAGHPAVLRLTEALNDQQEMRARYGAIQGVSQVNLVTIEDFGEVEMEGTPLIYLVMEATQESLADIVRERRLSLEETGEVAVSLVAALEALHAHGLVHGQVQAECVLAAGQVIKLRSDCVRPAPEGEDGERARAEDVFGLADVLNRSLTQQPLRDASDALALPEPYASIARNVVKGTWGLEKIAAEVRRFVRPAVTPQTAPLSGQLDAQPATPATVTPTAPATLQAGIPAEPLPQIAAALPRVESKPARAGSDSGPEQLLMYGPAAEVEKSSAYEREPEQQGNRTKSRFLQPDRRLVAWAGMAAGVCVVSLLLWHFADARSKTAADVTTAAPTAASSPAQPSAPAPVGIADPPAARSSPVSPGVRAAASPQGEVWRVVAYTYNVEAQARAKSQMIAKQHPDLHPQVFSRTGHAPYLVTLGGPLGQPAAETILQRARSHGLPRDTYVQNYSH